MVITNNQEATDNQFQKLVWKKLFNVPYGQTRSYLEQAELIGKRTACRAVGNANGVNRLAIIVPCHRIINSNGDIGGYGGGYVKNGLSIMKSNISIIYRQPT